MRVKLIASLGPSSSSGGVIESLLHEGVSGFRINLAHGGLGEWRALIRRVRDAEVSVGRPAAVITDIRGPSLRLGDFPEVLHVEAGSLVRFCVSGYSRTELRVPFPHKEVIKELAAGDLLVMDDGRARFRVVEVSEECFTAQALSTCDLRSRKNVAFPGRVFELPYLTGEDAEDVKVLCRDGVDYVGASHVRGAEDVEALRNFLRSVGCDALIITKVETRDAVKNLSEVVEASDAVLVARGDLGMNFGLEEVPVLQKEIVNTSLEAGKPVIVATQLLESMTSNPVPTRAEVSDVSNAVLEGVDALMLTGETAVGKYPVEAVRWLRRIAERAESMRQPPVQREGWRVMKSLKGRYAKGVVELAEDLNGVLAIYSMKGTTAFSVASLRPETRFYVAVPDVRIARKLSIVWGAQVRVIKAEGYMEGLEKLYSELMMEGELRANEVVVLTYGLRDREQVIKVRSVSSTQ
ncbi:MAG: pyruvate kinase [Zestosphaera sp.]